MSTDLKKIQTILPRSCDEEYLISLALKRQLTDKGVVNKQQIGPALVNTTLQKLTKISPFYSNIAIDNEWEDSSEQSSDPVLWKLLTDKNASESNNSDQTDSDDDIEGNDKFKESELKESSSTFPTVMYVDGPNISPSEIVNIAPGEGQILVSFTSEPNWEALPFPKDYFTGRNYFNEEREIPITPSIHISCIRLDRKKCCYKLSSFCSKETISK